MQGQIDVKEVISEALRAKGAEITGEGHGWNNGPYEDLRVKLENGLELYINIEDYVED